MAVITTMSVVRRACRSMLERRKPFWLLHGKTVFDEKPALRQDCKRAKKRVLPLAGLTLTLRHRRRNPLHIGMSFGCGRTVQVSSRSRQSSADTFPNGFALSNVTLRRFT